MAGGLSLVDKTKVPIYLSLCLLLLPNLLAYLFSLIYCSYFFFPPLSPCLKPTAENHWHPLCIGESCVSFKAKEVAVPWEHLSISLFISENNY